MIRLKNNGLSLELQGAWGSAVMEGIRAGLTVDGTYLLAGLPERVTESGNAEFRWSLPYRSGSIALNLRVSEGCEPGETMIGGEVVNLSEKRVSLDFIHPLAVRTLAAGAVRLGTDI